MASPAVALPLFLAAFAIHFSMEDAPADRPVERGARGALMVAGPAILHRPELAVIIEAATGDAGMADRLAYGVALIGVPSLLAITVIAARRRDWRLLAGAAALVLSLPLIGFPIGFILLHAWPQTLEHMRRLGCASLPAYLRLIAPVLAGAALVALAAAYLMRNADGAGLRALFAGLAALAVPHMLVTPWFERRRAEPALTFPAGRSI